jgi:hypothetical protein
MESLPEIKVLQRVDLLVSSSCLCDALLLEGLRKNKSLFPVFVSLNCAPSSVPPNRRKKQLMHWRLDASNGTGTETAFLSL